MIKWIIALPIVLILFLLYLILMKQYLWGG